MSFQINDSIVVELRKLSQSIALTQQTIRAMDNEELSYIHRNALISNVGASTRIENAVLTDAEVNWIDTKLTENAKTTAFLDHREFIKAKLSRDKERSIDEVAGCRAMLHLIYAQAREFFPFSETSLRAFHNELLQYYTPSAHYRGSYKTVPNSVVIKNPATGETLSVLETSPAGPITESAMRELIDWSAW